MPGRTDGKGWAVVAESGSAARRQEGPGGSGGCGDQGTGQTEPDGDAVTEPGATTRGRRLKGDTTRTDKQVPGLHEEGHWLDSSCRSGVEKMYNKEFLIYILAANVLSVCGTL